MHWMLLPRTPPAIPFHIIVLVLRLLSCGLMALFWRLVALKHRKHEYHCIFVGLYWDCSRSVPAAQVSAL